MDTAKLQLALDLLHEPLLERPVLPLLSAQIAAQAYDIVRDVRKSCAPSCQELGKFAALAMRECLRESALEIAGQAYNIVRDVRKSCAPSCQELGKFAALAMRECLRESALERHRLRECSGARL